MNGIHLLLYHSLNSLWTIKIVFPKRKNKNSKNENQTIGSRDYFKIYSRVFQIVTTFLFSLKMKSIVFLFLHHKEEAFLRTESHLFGSKAPFVVQLLSVLNRWMHYGTKTSIFLVFRPLLISILLLESHIQQVLYSANEKVLKIQF